MSKRIYDSDGFPLSGSTWASVNKEQYFKILEKVQSDYPEEIAEILKPKTTKIVIEPLSKRDLLGVISMFNLDNSFPTAKTAKINTLRNKFKKLVVSESNEEFNSYLVSEALMDRATNTKRQEISTTITKHNKTKRIMTFILSKYLDLDLEPKPEEPEEELEDEELEEDLDEDLEEPEEVQE